MKHSSYRDYLVVLLSIILAFNYVDRWALGVLLQDIKLDLELNDTQLGFLSGLAFTAFYAVMGVPIARWADRGDRVMIITLTTAVWSAAVALCGLATSFSQLLMIRVGVAIGEAGCVPPAHSLIADHFTRAERPRAVSLYLLGVPLSLVIGYLATGWINEFYGWRTTFVVVGAPGLVLAVLAWLTLKEPRRMKAEQERTRCSLSEIPASLKEPAMKEVFETLWTNSAFRHLLFCFSVWYFFGYGIQQWQPTFFIRSHGLQTGELGTWFALIYGVGSGFGLYLGGALARRYASGNERLQLAACAVTFSASAVIEASAYLVTNYHVAFAALLLNAFVGSMAQGPILATMQTLVPNRMRATSIAIIYFFANLIGMGCGPLAAGAVSDALQPLLGDESLRFALVALCPGYFWVSWHLWRASRTVRESVERVQAEGNMSATHPIKLVVVESQGR